MLTIFTRLASILLSILMFFSSFGSIQSYDVVDEENLLLSFVAIADTHLQGTEQRQARYLTQGLRNLEAATVQPDALVIAGDITMNGQKIEYFFLKTVFDSEFNPENLLLSAGNHDICIREDDYEKAKNRFTSNYNQITSRDIDKIYYSTVINEHYFLVLGSEAIAGTEQYFSEQQLEWLESMLSLAQTNSPGRPVFVVNHNPLKHTNSVDTSWPSGGSVGDQSDELMAILQAHENIVYISGHLHAPLNELSITPIDNVVFVNLPAFHKNEDFGTSFVFEVYEDEVLLRARNILSSQWLDYEYILSLS